MASILNTTKLNYHLERLIEEATTQITIVSPFLKIHTRLMNLLAEKVSADVGLTIIYGKSQLDEKLRQQLEEFETVTLFYCPTLHAKIYANTEEVIVASLNLYEFSQINNYELGVLIAKSGEPQSFNDVLAEIEMIKKASICKKQRVVTAAAAIPQYAKLSVTQLSKLLKVRNAEVFAFLQGEGLMVRQGDEWQLTEKGKSYGGEVMQSKRFGEYLVWPRDVIEVNR